MKKTLSLVLAVVMVLGMLNLSVFAEESAVEHVHNEGGWTCVYTEPIKELNCQHVHDEECGYVAPTEEVPCDCTDIDDDGVIDHVDGCGYVPADPGSPCTHECGEECNTTIAEGYWECAAPEETENTSNGPMKVSKKGDHDWGDWGNKDYYTHIDVKTAAAVTLDDGGNYAGLSVKNLSAVGYVDTTGNSQSVTLWQGGSEWSNGNRNLKVALGTTITMTVTMSDNTLYNLTLDNTSVYPANTWYKGDNYQNVGRLVGGTDDPNLGYNISGRSVFEVSAAACNGARVNNDHSINRDGLDLVLNVATIIELGEPVLNVTKTVAVSGKDGFEAAPGDTLIYTIKVENNGEADATNVKVTDVLDSNLEFVKVEGATKSGNDYTIGNVAVDETKTFTITATVKDSATDGTKIKNTATASCDEGLTDKDDAPEVTVKVPEPEPEEPNISVSKTTDQNQHYTAGQDVTWTIAVTNNGTQQVDSLSVVDSMSNVTVTAKDDNWDPTSFSLESGATATFTATLANAAEGSYYNKAQVMKGSDKLGEDTAWAIVDPDPNSQITITKTADKQEVLVGDIVTFTITVTSTNPNETEVTIADNLPEGLERQGGPVTMTAMVSATKTANLVVKAKVTKVGELTNTGIVTLPDGSTKTDTETITGVAPKLTGIIKALTNDPVPASVQIGDTVTLSYTITVTGDVGAKYTVTDTGATLAEGESWTGTIVADNAGNAQPVVLHVSKTVTAQEAGTLVVTNTAYVKPGDGTDPINPNDDPDVGHPSNEVVTRIPVTVPETPVEQITATWLPGYGDNAPIDSKQYNVGTTTVPAGDYPANPSRDGYRFTGWGDPVIDDNGNITITAQWEQIIEGPTYFDYTLRYDANGGSNAPSSQTGRGNITMRSGVPTRTGYTFQGWATSANGEVAYQPGDTYRLNANATLYAVWTEDTEIVDPDTPLSTMYNLTVEYQYEDGSKAADTVEKSLAAGADYSVESPVLEGYVASYELVVGTMPDEDVKVVVTYVKADETEVPEEQPPLVEAPDTQPPLVVWPDPAWPETIWVDPADQATEIPVEDVPLAEIPGEDVPMAEIPDGDVPMTGVPQTGDISLAWYVVAILSAMGLAVLTLKKREGEND